MTYYSSMPHDSHSAKNCIIVHLCYMTTVYCNVHCIHTTTQYKLHEIIIMQLILQCILIAS